MDIHNMHFYVRILYGGMILMGQSMLPVIIEYDYHLTGLRREGVFASLYSFVEKTSYMLVPLSIGIVLQLGLR